MREAAVGHVKVKMLLENSEKGHFLWIWLKGVLPWVKCGSEIGIRVLWGRGGRIGCSGVMED